MEIIKTPQEKLESFFYHSVNIEIYENILKIFRGNDFGEYSVLYLFNLIYREAEFYFNNDNNYLLIKKHFTELHLINLEFEALSNLKFIIKEVYKNKIPNDLQLSSLEFFSNNFKSYIYSDENNLEFIIESYSLYNYRNRINVYKTNGEKINYLIDLKARFLQEVIDYDGWQTDNSFDKKCDIEIERLKAKINPNETSAEEKNVLDLSDTNATEKIIYLQKLGVVDFLRTKQPFQTSINSLATVLSAVTGVNPKTKHLQSMLNAMLSPKGTAQKNNPLTKNETVQKVEKQLINIGFNLDKTI
jgi:hypothetical protein